MVKEDSQSPKNKTWVTTQITVLLIVISFLLFMSILFGISTSLAEVNVAIPMIAVVIALLSFGMSTHKIPVGKYTYIIMTSLVLTFLALITILLITQDFYVRTVTGFLISTLYYMMLGILAAVALAFSYWGKTEFITWEKTNLWRDLFFVGVAIWFVFGMTAYLSVATNTPFEVTPFLGVPFTASQVDYPSRLVEAGVKGAAGFIEGNFFFTFLLGFLAAVGITQILPKDSIVARLGMVIIISLIFGGIVAYLHTGLHDISQRDLLVFIGLFFFAGAATTLYFNTSFAFTIAQGLIDFMKALFSVQDPAMTQLAWLIFLAVSGIAGAGFIFWRGNKWK